jgi:hypothetical protein
MKYQISGRWPARLFCCALAAVAITGCKITDSDSQRDEGRELTVPKKSHIVAEGNGDLSYKTSRDGTIYVYDVDSDVTLFRQRIREGQRFTLSPEQNLATLDGKKVHTEDLKKKHQHRLYFERD